MRWELTLGIHPPVVVDLLLLLLLLLLLRPRGESPSRDLVDRCDGAAVEGRARRNHKRVAALQAQRGRVALSQDSGLEVPVWDLGLGARCGAEDSGSRVPSILKRVALAACDRGCIISSPGQRPWGSG
jgi:hypothetical protein